MKSFLYKSVLFIGLLLIISYVVYSILNAFQSSYYKKSLKTRWAIELTDKHVDYLFLGSSRMANMIAANAFDSTLNTTSINLATPGSSYGESYVLLQQYLTHRNTTKTLILSFDFFKSRYTNPDEESFTPLTFKHFDFFH